MATHHEVKQYLALWFQLGKSVENDRTGERFCIRQIAYGSGYSWDFERCWHCIERNPSRFHLDGDPHTIADLLTPQWEIQTCPRCVMPVPLSVLGCSAGPCTCHDLPLWPNTEIPQPHLPVSDTEHLSTICSRLILRNLAIDEDEDQEPEDQQPNAG